MANRAYLQLAKEFLETCSKTPKTFMKPLGTARPLIIESGRVVVEFEVTQEMANPRGTLHGGCLTALVDVSTTMAGVALRGATGMSTNMHVNFIAPVKVGETVRMDSVITKSGKTLAYARSDLFLKEGNKPVATALHTLIYPNNNR